MPYFKHVVLLTLLVVTTSPSTDCVAAVISIGPLPYLSAADSPLLADPTLDMVLEDFEDGLFNVPGVTTEPIEDPNFPFVNDGRGIVVGPGPDTDSVDADDGLIDGSGIEGHAFRSTATVRFATLPTLFANPIEFRLLPASDGSYPNAFGFVWTDGEPGPDANIELEVGVREIDAEGIITTRLFTFHTIKGDDDFNGGTGEDKFVGIFSDTGIFSVQVNTSFFGFSEFDDGSTRQLFFEIDHLQFGFSRVPEPSAFLLLWVCIGLCWIAPRQKTLCVFVNIRA